MPKSENKAVEALRSEIAEMLRTGPPMKSSEIIKAVMPNAYDNGDKTTMNRVYAALRELSKAGVIANEGQGRPYYIRPVGEPNVMTRQTRERRSPEKKKSPAEYSAYAKFMIDDVIEKLTKVRDMF